MIDGPLPQDVERFLDELNERANGGDQDALGYLDDLLDRHPHLWREVAAASRNAADGWAAVLADAPVLRACVRREAEAWAAELAGPAPPPLVKAAADAAAVAVLVARFAGRELERAMPMKRTKAAKRAMSANRQVQDALKLVALAKTAEAAVAAARSPAANNPVPKLYAATG